MSDIATQTKKRSKRPAGEEKTLILLHIEKTGGSTMKEIIRRKFPPEAMLKIRGGNLQDYQEDISLLEGPSEEDKRRIRYISGPFFGIHKYLPQPYIYFIMFRDPVERVISEYYWVLRRRPDSPVSFNNKFTSSHRSSAMTTFDAHNEVVSKNMSLEDYVRNGVLAAWNGQTRFVRRVPEIIPPSYGPVSLSSDDLSIAKANLSDNCIIGLLGRFDESLILIKRMLGWRTIDILYVKENVAKNRPSIDNISDETIKLIEDNNKLDIELYEFASQLFEEQIKQQGPSFSKELRTFRLLNRTLGPFLKIYVKFGVPFISLVKLLRAWIRGEVSAKHVYKKVYDYFDYLKNVR